MILGLTSLNQVILKLSLGFDILIKTDQKKNRNKQKKRLIIYLKGAFVGLIFSNNLNVPTHLSVLSSNRHSTLYVISSHCYFTILNHRK